MGHILVVFTVVGLFMGGGWLWQPQQVALAEESITWQLEKEFVYLTVLEDALNSEAEYLDVQVVTNPDFFGQAIDSPSIEAILLHPDVLNYLDKGLMHKAYERGVIVVGINVPLSTIGELTGAKARTKDWIADLEMNYAHKQIAISYVYSKPVLKEGQSIGVSDGLYTDFLPDLEIAVQQITYLTEFDPLNPHYPNQASDNVQSLNEKYKQVYSGWASWGDPSGGTLVGLSDVYASGSWWYAWTQSTHSHTVYLIRAKGVATSYCDYPHVIYDHTVQLNNTSTVSTPAGIVGPCRGNPVLVTLNADHRAKRYSGTPWSPYYFGGTTYDQLP